MIFALVLRGEGDGDENKPLKLFNFKGTIRAHFSLTMTSTSLTGQPQWELKYKINTDQELLDMHLLCVYMCVCVCIYIYTGCNGRNGPDFGRVFLMLNYTENPQNTYIQSWTVSEIMASEVWNFDSCYTFTDYQIHIETGRNMWFL